MIISHKYRYLFIEVPHTATTAIAQELRSFYGGEKILDKHANYTEFRRQASREERKYFVFAGVRNPLDIVVTEFYKYRSNHKGAFTDLDGRGTWVTPEHLEQFRYAVEGGDFAGYLRKFHRSVYHNWFLIGHRRFDHVMRFENVAADFETALVNLGIEPVRPLPTANQSARPKKFADLYSPEIVPLAVRTFGPFMRQWGYEFPAGWGAAKPGLMSRTTYRLQELFVNWGANYLTLTGRSPSVRWAKRLIDAIT